MKVLLLGAKGMLGQALQKTFSDCEVTAWDKDELDITNQVEVIDKISVLKPEVIINAAAYTNVDGAESDEETAFSINGDGVDNIAKAAKETDATLVHYSTDYVFPGTEKEGYDENNETGPAINTYGASKLAGEQALKKNNPRYYLIRTAWLYGPGGKNFVDTMRRLGSEKESLSVINDQHGCPTFTIDLAQATRQLLDSKYEPGIYHLTNSGQTTWYDFACEIFRLSGQNVKVNSITSAEYPVPAQRPAYSILRNTKFPPLRLWQAALAEYLIM